MSKRVLGSLCFVSLFLLAGCQTVAPKSSTQAASSTGVKSQAILSDELSAQLTANNTYGVIEANNTPWGDQVELHLSPVYFSAKGSLCREIDVKNTRGMTNPVIACQDKGRWTVQRNVTKALQHQAL